MFGKCIKVVNGTFFLLVIVFDVSMNREALEQQQQKANKIYFDYLASPVIPFLLIINKVLITFYFLIDAKSIMAK
jgi:hypothetical protein